MTNVENVKNMTNDRLCGYNNVKQVPFGPFRSRTLSPGCTVGSRTWWRLLYAAVYFSFKGKCHISFILVFNVQPLQLLQLKKIYVLTAYFVRFSAAVSCMIERTSSIRLNNVPVSAMVSVSVSSSSESSEDSAAFGNTGSLWTNIGQNRKVQWNTRREMKSSADTEALPRGWGKWNEWNEMK